MCTSVSPQEFKFLKVNTDTQVLDVRTPKEHFEEGYIGEDNLNVEDPAFEQRLTELDKSRTYLVYCKTGVRSRRACEIMRSKGFNVINLDGGFEKWKTIYA